MRTHLRDMGPQSTCTVADQDASLCCAGATAVFLFLRVFHLNLLSILCGAGALLVTVMVVWSLVGKFPLKHAIQS